MGTWLLQWLHVASRYLQALSTWSRRSLLRTRSLQSARTHGSSSNWQSFFRCTWGRTARRSESAKPPSETPDFTLCHHTPQRRVCPAARPAPRREEGRVCDRMLRFPPSPAVTPTTLLWTMNTRSYVECDGPRETDVFTGPSKSKLHAGSFPPSLGWGSSTARRGRCRPRGCGCSPAGACPEGRVPPPGTPRVTPALTSRWPRVSCSAQPRPSFLQ